MNCDRSKAVLPIFPPMDTEADCPVDRALQMVDAARKNSCGLDVLCREGLLQIYTILRDISSGKGEEDDIPLMKELLEVIQHNAGCGMAAETAAACYELIQTQEDVFQKHIMRRLCPAMVCAQLYTLHVLPAACNGCGACAAVCAEGAIAGGDSMIHVIDSQRCVRCLQCVSACPQNAITKAGAVKPKVPEAPVPVGGFEDASAERRRRRRG